VGGAGAFGSRLADGLAATVDCEVVIGGRGTSNATRTRDDLRWRHPRAQVDIARIDAARAGAGDIRCLRPDVVVDAAGPYRPGTYGLARACIEAGVSYVDIADGRAFVTGFPAALDEAARSAGVVAVTGASSTPALSNAALDEVVRGWRRVDRIEVAISPGNRAPRGLSVFQSILAYAGKPVHVLRAGGWAYAPGWGLTLRRPMEGLGTRRLSLCETPDLDIMPARYPDAGEALFRAGLELGFLHLGLTAATLPVRMGMLDSLVPLASTFRLVAALFERMGTDRGGMEVVAEGLDATGAHVRGTWSLVAEAGDGPHVPTLPALALVRAILSGSPPAPGARACVGILGLAAIEAEMRRLRITTRIGTVPLPR